MLAGAARYGVRGPSFRPASGEMSERPDPKRESRRPQDAVACAFCGRRVPRSEALRDDWYGEREFVCSPACRVAREHALTCERDDESTGA
jgi:hypothetical protein